MLDEEKHCVQTVCVCVCVFSAFHLIILRLHKVFVASPVPSMNTEFSLMLSPTSHTRQITN